MGALSVVRNSRASDVPAVVAVETMLQKSKWKGKMTLDDVSRSSLKFQNPSSSKGPGFGRMGCEMEMGLGKKSQC